MMNRREFATWLLAVPVAVVAALKPRTPIERYWDRNYPGWDWNRTLGGARGGGKTWVNHHYCRCSDRPMEL